MTGKQKILGICTKITACALSATLLGGATSATCTLTVKVENLRSQDGMLRLCLTTQKKYFPDCDKDPNAVHTSVSAKSGTARFDKLPEGNYALSILHDENTNSQLDKFAGIPKEGIGFSRNPSFNFGPPKFNKALFTAKAGKNTQIVRMKYFL